MTEGKQKSKLSQLAEEVPVDAGPAVARLLRQLAHDLDTPIATLVMELYSGRALVDDLTDSVRTRADRPSGDRTLEELSSVLQNLGGAAAGLQSLSQALRTLAALCEASTLRDSLVTGTRFEKEEAAG